ncbi:MAG: hypothetical protein ACLQVD_16455, partial [Capsulimonadaceae bacterium]
DTQSTTRQPVSPPGFLVALRKFAAPETVLPENDPLLFHQFMPVGLTITPLAPRGVGGILTSEEVSFNMLSSGRDQTNLFVSRLPELHLSGAVPLGRVRAAPNDGDPRHYRQYLRQIVLYAGASADAGKYVELPADIRHDREQYAAWLNTAPILIGQNTVIAPGVLTNVNRYDNFKSDGYHYNQATLSLMHYFTNRSAFGVDYMWSQVSGNSPFNFDVLDSSQEIDTRLQIGNRHIAVGGLVRYDAVLDRVIDYKITLAPGVGGLIPILTYDYQNKNTSLGLAIEGVTL